MISRESNYTGYPAYKFRRYVDARVWESRIGFKKKVIKPSNFVTIEFQGVDNGFPKTYNGIVSRGVAPAAPAGQVADNHRVAFAPSVPVRSLALGRV